MKTHARIAIAAVVASLVGVGGVGSAFAALSDVAVTPAPVASAQQAETLKWIHYIIDRSHYRKKPLDDTFSEAVLNAYLKRLDPGRSVFVQSDIDQFQKVRHEFDDYIRAGVLRPAFEIFKVLRFRVDQRVDYALTQLQMPFDFNKDESYWFDRKDAPWAADSKALNDLWRKRIKNDILNLRLAGREEDEINQVLERRYTNLARRTRQFNAEDVFQVFVNSYTSTIEPHTNYFSPRASENFEIQMRLSLEGIGAVLQQTDDEHTKVLRVMPGGPADLARELKAEDRIIGVAQGDGEIVDVIGWRLDDVVSLIRGPKHSTVRLEILPGEGDPDGQPRVIAIRRDKIELEDQAASKRVLNVQTGRGAARIGVIDLPSFYIDFDGLHRNLPDYRSTTRDIRKLLAEFEAEGGINGLVIDLRGNGGGSLTEAVSLTGLFIRKGPVVQVLNTGGQVKVDRDPDPSIVYSGPLAVLVDRYSASSSEIFAGAIQDYRRGIIIGEPTFGKGTVQHLVDLNRFGAPTTGRRGQLKVTIAQFFRINGDSTQHRGVIPDFLWPMADRTDTSGERTLPNAIEWRHINGAAFQYFRDNPKQQVMRQLHDWHRARVSASAEFRYLREIGEIGAERRRQQSITLNQTTRETERASRDERRLRLENRRRQALGQGVAASAEALDRELEEQSRATEGQPPEPDALLIESGNILGDYLHAIGSTGVHGAAIAQQEGVDEELSH